MAAALERLQQALRPLGVYRIKNEGLLFAELSAYAAALSLLDEKMSGLEREAFISTAEDEGLSKRERLFTNEKQSVSLLDRRHMLLYRAAVKRSDFTVSALEKALTAAGMRAAVMKIPAEPSPFTALNSSAGTTRRRRKRPPKSFCRRI